MTASSTSDGDAFNLAPPELDQQPSSWKRSLIGEYIGCLAISFRVAITRRLQKEGIWCLPFEFLTGTSNRIIPTIGRRAKKLISEFGRRAESLCRKIKLFWRQIMVAAACRKTAYT